MKLSQAMVALAAVSLVASTHAMAANLEGLDQSSGLAPAELPYNENTDRLGHHRGEFNPAFAKELPGFDLARETEKRQAAWSEMAADPTPITNVPTISYDNVMGHLREFQAIADRNGGDRSHGRPGYKESVNYVKAKLDAAGFQTTIQEFTNRGAVGYNLIADLPGGRTDRTLIVGAHLDGVPNVAAISDNGSGSAGILEVALEAAKAKQRGETPENHLRFIWFGAEELWMVGSSHYVKQLSQADRANIMGYVNYDMTASPNGGYFVLDGDNSDMVGRPAGPPGSAFLEQAHHEYYKSIGMPTIGWDTDGVMDYGPFMTAGIAVGGVATGASSAKSAEHAKLWGGEAGKPFDSCYHQRCDNINNLNEKALRINSQAIGYVTWRAGNIKAHNGATPNPVPTTSPTPTPTVTPTTSPTLPTPACATSDLTKTDIPDMRSITRSVNLDCAGKASAKSTVSVNISHTYRSDVVVTLVAPSGREFSVFKADRDDRDDNVTLTKELDLSSENASGSWTLKVSDVSRRDTGTLNSWSIKVN